MFLYLGYPVVLGQLSVLLPIAFVSSDHSSLLVPSLAVFCYCVSRIKMKIKQWQFCTSVQNVLLFHYSRHHIMPALN